MKNFQIKKQIKSVIPAITIFFLSAFFSPQIVRAYDNDTHFWLTYYLARKAGYTKVQATQIASANVSVDYDDDTKPVGAKFDQWGDYLNPIAHYQYIVITFHALPFKAAVNREAKVKYNNWWSPIVEEDGDVQTAAYKLIDEKRKLFWENTIERKINPGVFLHYSQDIFAHQNFKSWLGHAGYFYVDFLSANRAKAEDMAFDTLKYLIVSRNYSSEKPDFADTHDINYFIERKDISIKDYDEIKEIVFRLARVNIPPIVPSKIMGTQKYYENNLVKSWNSLSQKLQRRFYKMFPPTYLFDALRIKNQQPVPNSYEARLIVEEFLKRNNSGEKLPHIWRYDLKNDYPDYLKESCTKRAYVYKTDYQKHKNYEKIPYIGKYEETNKSLTNQSYCLPFNLVENSILEIPGQ